jgi:hypothetical protein
MSVTSGVVSRIEVTSYVHGAAELLGIQIDAAVSIIICIDVKLCGFFLPLFVSFVVLYLI